MVDSTKQAFLNALRAAPGQWQSGESLAKLLGISRSAVWKAAKELRSEGLLLESAPRRGYRMAEGGELFTVEEFRSLLEPIWQAEVWPSISSTNDRARAAAAAGNPGPLLIAAAEQTAGRGRRGRCYFSPAHSGLYFSVLLRPALSSVEVSLVTTAAAVAVLRALQRYGVDITIRWVNDLMVGEKKVGGILTESVFSLEDGGLEYLVAGFGLNLTAPANSFPAGLSDAGAIFEGAAPVSRAELATSIALIFKQLVDALPDADFLAEYRAANLLQPGMTIRVFPLSGVSYPALVREIDDVGRLEIELLSGERRRLSGGEISIVQ